MHHNRTHILLALGLTLAGTVACDSDDGPGGNDDVVVEAVLVENGFAQPVHLTAPAGDDRLFIVELGGTIRIIEAGAALGTPFLDISANVSTGGERGLLSMAFDPQYATNRRFYVNYTDLNGNTRVERYVASVGDPDVADAGSAELILAVNQPEDNHNGGHLLFGPDGMLYVAMGDGGGNGLVSQDLTSLLGKLLRLDVRGAAPYAVPPGNPYVGSTTGARAEIWASGLRNPWRIAFDDPSDRIYIADVGETSLEEINVESVTADGLNYGWNVMEGTECFNAASCSQAGLTLPKHTYDHAGGRCSITGGAVYRGDAMPSMRGHYFYADLCQDGVRSLRVSGGSTTDHRLWETGDLGNIVSFGTDSDGEMYVISAGGGVYRLSPAP